MRVTNLVLNSLRKDPRVQRSARLAHENVCAVHFVGMQDSNYDQAFLDALPYPHTLVMVDQRLYGPNVGVLTKVYRELSVFFGLVRAVIKSRPDVIHANDFDALPIAWLAALVTRAKILYDSHEIYCENYHIATTKLRKTLMMVAERYFIRRVGQVVSVSHAASKKLAEIYRIPEPLVVTNCAFRVDIDLNARKHPGFEVLYHGRMTDGRGYEEFVMAAQAIPAGVTLVLRGYGNLEPQLKEMVREHGFEDRVRFAPAVEIHELIPSATESHVGVVLTKPVCINFEYTVSNKLFEYLHAGIPVILSHVPEHRYLIEKYDFGLLVDDVTPAHIAAAITRLYEDPALYQRLRAKAITAAKELCWEQEGMRFIAAYQRLAGQAPASTAAPAAHGG